MVLVKYGGIIVSIFCLLVYITIVVLFSHYRISIQLLRQTDGSYITRCYTTFTSDAIKKNINVVTPTDYSDTSKVLLLYSTLHQMRYWFDVKPKDLNMLTRLPNCEYRCDVTYDRRAVPIADATLFHGPDVYYSSFYFKSNEFSASVLRNESRQRKKGQKWIFFSHESPHYYHQFQDYYDLFDWTMSYKYTSDIFIPMTSFYRKLGSDDYVSPTKTNYAQGKNRLGIWLANNCNLPRDKYIEELRKYIPITVGGKCPKMRFNETVVCEYDSDECTKFIKSHKFFFAFENSFCDFYVTEKYWSKAIEMGLVPVVMGARYDQFTVIPGSYIDVFDFPSIESLANHLKVLDADDDEYNKYFNWKRTYKTVPSPSALCEACKALWNNQTSEAYKDIWSDQQDCKPFEWKPRHIEKLVIDSARSNKIKQWLAN